MPIEKPIDTRRYKPRKKKLGWQNDNVDEIKPADAYALLESDPQSQLVDVRTKAEWVFAGTPDLSGLGKSIFLIEWQSYPDMAVAPDFAEMLERELSGKGVERTARLLFICRSGVRSMAAARDLARRGWRCTNVAEGFEGRLDSLKHRGVAEGWKAARLPWSQS